MTKHSINTDPLLPPYQYNQRDVWEKEIRFRLSAALQHAPVITSEMSTKTNPEKVISQDTFSPDSLLGRLTTLHEGGELTYLKNIVAPEGKLVNQFNSYVHARNQEGQTPLMVALNQGEGSNISLFLPFVKDYDQNCTDKKGRNIAHYLAEKLVSLQEVICETQDAQDRLPPDYDDEDVGEVIRNDNAQELYGLLCSVLAELPKALWSLPDSAGTVPLKIVDRLEYPNNHLSDFRTSLKQQKELPAPTRTIPSSPLTGYLSAGLARPYSTLASLPALPIRPALGTSFKPPVPSFPRLPIPKIGVPSRLVVFAGLASLSVLVPALL